MIPDRYNYRNFVRAVQDPSMFVNEVSHQVEYGAYRLFESTRKYRFRYRYGGGVDVMSRDWDNLIILDACRFDIFSEYNTIDGELESMVSVASKTPEFVEKTFIDRDLHDTVYVSENPHAEDIDDDVFYTILKVYNNLDISDAEADSHNIPREANGQEQVRQAAIDASDKFPDKRLIVHFMPPHFPALGPTADEIRDELNQEYNLRFKQINRIRNNTVPEKQTADNEVWLSSLASAAEQGYISSARLRECYAENLQLVIKEVEKLLPHLEGKTVVTSDHGELLGDKKIYRPHPTRIGHHKHVYLPELRLVPWLIINDEVRREIVAKDPIGSATVPDDVVNERLKTLGYLE